jgi:hypothetical protein
MVSLFPEVVTSIKHAYSEEFLETGILYLLNIGY